MAKNNKISVKRQRKIDHIREISTREGWSRTKVRDKGLHHMNMKPEDLQIAMNGTIY